jgi:hypothetical protein
VSKKSNSTAAGFGAVAAGLEDDEPPKSPNASEDFVFEEESAKGSKLDTWLGRRSSFFGVGAAATGFFSTDLGGSAFFVTTSAGRSNLVGLFWKS